MLGMEKIYPERRLMIAKTLAQLACMEPCHAV